MKLSTAGVDQQEQEGIFSLPFNSFGLRRHNILVSFGFLL